MHGLVRGMDSHIASEIVARIIEQTRLDIARYLRGNHLTKVYRKRTREDAMDAIQFLYSESFDWYLNLMGMPQQDYDDYRRAILESSVSLSERRPGGAR